MNDKQPSSQPKCESTSQTGELGTTELRPEHFLIRPNKSHELFFAAVTALAIITGAGAVFATVAALAVCATATGFLAASTALAIVTSAGSAFATIAALAVIAAATTGFLATSIRASSPCLFEGATAAIRFYHRAAFAAADSLTVADSIHGG